MPDFMIYIIVAVAGHHVARWMHKKGWVKAAVGLSLATLLLSGWVALQYLFMALSDRSLIAAVIGLAFCWPVYENVVFLRGLGLWRRLVERLKRFVGR